MPLTNKKKNRQQWWTLDAKSTPMHVGVIKFGVSTYKSYKILFQESRNHNHKEICVSALILDSHVVRQFHKRRFESDKTTYRNMLN